jgi:hypothetical protein
MDDKDFEVNRKAGVFSVKRQLVAISYESSKSDKTS